MNRTARRLAGNTGSTLQKRGGGEGRGIISEEEFDPQDIFPWFQYSPGNATYMLSVCSFLIFTVIDLFGITS